MSRISYNERLIKTGLLPLSYWHEYLDIVYLYKMLVSSQDRNIQIKTTCRVTRENSGTAQITLHIPPANTLTFQNSFYCRSSGTFNCLPSVLRQSNLSINQFKCNLFNHYQKMSEEIYDIAVPQTFKTICVKCHSCRPLLNRVVNNHHLYENFIKWIFSLYIQLQISLISGNLQLAT